MSNHTQTSQMKCWANNGYFNPINQPPEEDVDSTWVCGPTNKIQDQHVPGYTGHVHSLISENLHGKTFARLTNKSLAGEIEPGFIISPEERFQTSYKNEFDLPSQKKAYFTGKGDSSRLEPKYQTPMPPSQPARPLSPSKVPPIDRMPVVGYQGYKPTFMNPLRKQEILQAQKEAFDANLASESEPRPQLELKNMEVPTMGYTGFLKGNKAENVYGKSFQRAAIESLVHRANNE